MNLVNILADTYVDSVLLMSATRAMQEAQGVDFATALMCTPANLRSLEEQGFSSDEIQGSGANDLALAVIAGSKDEAQEALDAGRAALEQESAGGAPPGEAGASVDRRAELERASVALISVPGDYAALEAHKALSAGLHVLLFSDNVDVAAEVELKRRAVERGLLLMGPGAGTAILSGVGLGFANAVRRGPVGVVSAAGTGAQEVTTLLHRWGSGISHAIGVGGRDLDEEVGGIMTGSALRALEQDDGTEVILLVSKPPSRRVAQALLHGLGSKPTIAAFIGLEGDLEVPRNVKPARTLEEAALRALETTGGDAPPFDDLAAEIADATSALPADRRSVRGLFSGGTLCYEAMVVLSDRLGAIHSNTPLREGWGLPAPDGAHVCLDLGEEEYTRGRPHPMIDPEPRADMIEAAASEPSVGVIFIDVVLGYGAHHDPASVLAPACARAIADDGPAVAAYVLGTDEDPQSLEDQRRQMKEAGCILASTGVRTALAAAAIAERRPSIAEERA